MQLFRDFVSRFDKFPDTRQMALGARECYNKAYKIGENVFKTNPDDVLLNWVDTEFRLFKCMEEKFYADMITHSFDSIDTFIQTANEVLNRRKSRAGKSLEHHLSDIFVHNALVFEEQAVTEDNKSRISFFPMVNVIVIYNFQLGTLLFWGLRLLAKIVGGKF